MDKHTTAAGTRRRGLIVTLGGYARQLRSAVSFDRYTRPLHSAVRRSLHEAVTPGHYIQQLHSAAALGYCCTLSRCSVFALSIDCLSCRCTRQLHPTTARGRYTRSIYGPRSRYMQPLHTTILHGRFTRPSHLAVTRGRYTRSVHSAVILGRYTRPLHPALNNIRPLPSTVTLGRYLRPLHSAVTLSRYAPALHSVITLNRFTYLISTRGR